MFINILKANSRITELEAKAEADNKAWLTRCEDKEAELVELQKKFEAITDVKINHDEILNKVKAEYETKIGELTNAITANKVEHETKVALLTKDNETKVVELLTKHEAASATAKKNFEETLANVKIEHEAIVVSLKKEMETTKTLVNNQVAQVVSSLGISSDSIPNETVISELNPTTAVEKFNALTGLEQSKFYAENRSLIMQGLKLAR